MAHQRRRLAVERLLQPHRLSVSWWFALAAVLVLGDYLAGPYVQFAATFVVPVLLAAWYSGLKPALGLAVLLPLSRAVMMLTVWGEPWDASAIIITAIVRILVFGSMAALLARLAHHERELKTELEMLEKFLSICMHCKSIKNERGQWEKLEKYISSRVPTQFSHGLCENCADAYYPEFRSGRTRS